MGSGLVSDQTIHRYSPSSLSIIFMKTRCCKYKHSLGTNVARDTVLDNVVDVLAWNYTSNCHLSYSLFSRPTVKQYISLHSSAFCQPGTAECACVALRNKMAVGRENDEYYHLGRHKNITPLFPASPQGIDQLPESVNIWLSGQPTKLRPSHC
jgi:hypothetical protein